MSIVMVKSFHLYAVNFILCKQHTICFSFFDRGYETLACQWHLDNLYTCPYRLISKGLEVSVGTFLNAVVIKRQRVVIPEKSLKFITQRTPNFWRCQSPPYISHTRSSPCVIEHIMFPSASLPWSQPTIQAVQLKTCGLTSCQSCIALSTIGRFPPIPKWRQDQPYPKVPKSYCNSQDKRTQRHEEGLEQKVIPQDI